MARPPVGQWVRKAGLSALNSRPWQATSRWLRGTKAIERLEAQYDGAGLEAPIIAYFGDGPAKLYQILQWLPVFEKLNEELRVAIVLRSPGALQQLRTKTTLPLVLKVQFDPLQDFYYDLNPKVALYVNNGVRNFQSLGYAPMVHVHLNHGESDKISMVSNQVKAYDRVFVAGPAAIDRHKMALIEFDFNKLVEVGRPQLDIELTAALPPTDRRTVMYAPTWEGENIANNYTSIDMFGEAIVATILKTPNVRLVYKPHPRVEQSEDSAVSTADARIRELIDTANSEGGGHIVAMQGDILPMFADVDLLVTDVSSVGLDFLYLRPDAPLILTDRRANATALTNEAPIARATPVLSSLNKDDFAAIIEGALVQDSLRARREEMRRYYFGNLHRGESERLFIDNVGRLVQSRINAQSDTSTRE